MHIDWEQLEADMARTGAFYAPRLSAHFLAHNFYDGRAIPRVRPAGKRMECCAYIAWLKTPHPRYVEIALAYVADDLKGNGVLREIMAELLSTTPTGTLPFLITGNPAMKKVAAGFGFQTETPSCSHMPRYFAHLVGISDDRLPDSATRKAPRYVRASERVLMRCFDKQ